MLNDITFEFNGISKTKKDFKKFGIMIGIILGIFSGLLFIYEKDSFYIFSYLGLCSFLFGLLVPILLKPFYYFWMFFAIVLGWFMTRVILTLLYFFIMTPLSIIGKIFGQDFLYIYPKNNPDSFWNNRENSKKAKQNLEKQF